jgi:hypothetical protein
MSYGERQNLPHLKPPAKKRPRRMETARPMSASSGRQRAHAHLRYERTSTGFRWNDIDAAEPSRRERPGAVSGR